eukprot:CAMPEP_0184685364 /NCGR_PEP_ID=MMETSP0312-20130426/18728_1 /TAXON_ID=31354 /ORGANISM="Compsopogon coeruleus, Strain SAG 36.94" /LENGTH=269 /DNA_ID=CAMNT_0027139411 /DNA_START=115 /DNA_END=924 /DNA_ORIENTATION=-
MTFSSVFLTFVPSYAGLSAKDGTRRRYMGQALDRRSITFSTRRLSRVDSSVTMCAEGASGKSIDFSEVNLAEAGKACLGMIFRPEEDSEDQITDSRCNIGWSQPLQDAINNQINVEYTASYVYHALWAFFQRDTVALPGFAQFFLDQSDEERTHATQLMTYQTKRGGKVVLKPVAVPSIAFDRLNSISDAQFAVDLHLQLEKFNYAKLREVHRVAQSHDDPQMQDEVEKYLAEQLDAIKQAADLLAQIKRCGTGHGIYHIDRVLSQHHK